MARLVQAAELGKVEKLLGNVFEAELRSVLPGISYPFDHQREPRTVSAGYAAQVNSDFFGCI